MTNQDRIEELEVQIKELEEELETADFGSYQYDVANGEYEYLTLVLKKMKKS